MADSPNASTRYLPAWAPPYAEVALPPARVGGAVFVPGASRTVRGIGHVERTAAELRAMTVHEPERRLADGRLLVLREGLFVGASA